MSEMKKLLLTAIVVLACAKAHAGDPNTVPFAMMGPWCPVTSDTYARCTTKDRGNIQISGDSMRGKENGCNFTNVESYRSVHVVDMECSNADGSDRTNTTSTFSILDNGLLLIKDWQDWLESR
jgi:hypothetical protein